MVRIICFCILIGIESILSVAHALEMATIKDNEARIAKVSVQDLNRVTVADDRIQAVRGVEGFYQLTKDEQLGAIFIKPAVRHPFAIFITTEQGHAFTLLLQPQDIPAETLVLKPFSATSLAEKWEENTPYHQLLLTLIKDMTNAAMPAGYVAISPSNYLDKKIFAPLAAQKIKMVRGRHLQGEVWCIKNKNRIVQDLMPQKFYQPGVRAIALSQKQLKPGEECLLYRVVNHD